MRLSYVKAVNNKLINLAITGYKLEILIIGLERSK